AHRSLEVQLARLRVRRSRAAGGVARVRARAVRAARRAGGRSPPPIAAPRVHHLRSGADAPARRRRVKLPIARMLGAAIGAIGLALAGCGGGGTVTVTP